MFFNKIPNRAKAKKQKNRTEPTIYDHRDHQTAKLVVLNASGGHLELFIYRKIVRKFRKWSKRKKYSVLFRFMPNHIFSNKVKNSRMGKGKGKFSRLVVRFKKYDIFMVMGGFSAARMRKYFKLMTMYFRGKFIVKQSLVNGSRLIGFKKLTRKLTIVRR